MCRVIRTFVCMAKLWRYRLKVKESKYFSKLLFRVFEEVLTLDDKYLLRRKKLSITIKLWNTLDKVVVSVIFNSAAENARVLECLSLLL